MDIYFPPPPHKLLVWPVQSLAHVAIYINHDVIYVAHDVIYLAHDVGQNIRPQRMRFFCPAITFKMAADHLFRALCFTFIPVCTTFVPS